MGSDGLGRLEAVPPGMLGKGDRWYRPTLVGQQECLRAGTRSLAQWCAGKTGEGGGDVTSGPFPIAGAGLGQQPNPEVAESLGLPITASGDGTSAQRAAVAENLGSSSSGGGSSAEQEGAKSGKELEHLLFIVSESLPPVPVKLVAKILELEYVDMAELPKDSIKAECRRGKDDSSSGSHKAGHREIPDILS